MAHFVSMFIIIISIHHNAETSAIAFSMTHVMLYMLYTWYIWTLVTALYRQNERYGLHFSERVSLTWLVATQCDVLTGLQTHANRVNSTPAREPE